MRVMGLMFALVALTSTTAGAQTLDVNALVHQGVELRRSRRDLEALEVFQQAWEASHAPRVMAQIGFAELALGRWVDAEAHLIEAHSAATDPWIAEHRDLLEDAMRDVGQHVGSLDVHGNVAGAEVRVEGRRVGALPFARPVRVAAGTTTLEVGAPGYLPVRRSIVVTPTSLTRETVTLLAVDAAFGTPPPPPLDVVNPPGAAPSDSGSTMRALGWTAAGGALLGVGIGVVALVVRNDAVARWNGDACLAGGRTRLENCGDDQDTAATMGALSVAGWVTGAALAATSVVLFMTAPASAGRARAGGFRCGIGPGDVGVTCGGAL
jgi:hypothetical protein